jgi:hypothetical protein
MNAKEPPISTPANLFPAMLNDLNALSLACKQAEARHETAYTMASLLPPHDPTVPEWSPVWDKVRELRLALDEANAAYFAGLAQQREAIRLASASTYEVQYIVSPPTPSEALAA